MKTIKYIPITVVILMMMNAGLKAQNSGLEGSYLNIGTNTLIENNAHLWGNAMGTNNYIGSANTLAVGNSDTIGEYSVNAIILGGLNKVHGIASMAFGNTIKINGNFSYGLGRYLKTNANYSMVIGYGIAGSGEDPDVFLENNNENSLKIGFNSTRATLSVSSSPNDYPGYGGHINRTGKIAIGDVPIPDIAAKLHIRSDEGEDAGIILEPKDLEHSNTFIRMRDEYHGIEVDEDGITTIKSLALGYNATEIKRPLLLKGVVGVNVPEYHRDDLTNAYALWVSGGVIAETVTIKTTGAWWSDYVFNPDYPLMPTGDLREYIGANRHLPDVPSEAEVMENGIELGGMQSILLKKIEELTLYMLRQQETIDRLETRIAELEDK